VRNERRIAAKERGVVAARRFGQPDSVCSRSERVGRLVESDMPVGADSGKQEIDSACRFDVRLVTFAFGVQIRRCAV
jgi:hypothetical protein